MRLTGTIILLCLAAAAHCADVREPESCVSFPCLIFEDNFDYLDHDIWEHEITMTGGGNFEFEMYVNNRSNSYVRDSTLFIKPSLTADYTDENFLYNGVMDIWGMNGVNEVCTANQQNGCLKTGNPDGEIINPVMSARMRTSGQFQFRYGRIEVRAKMPRGDWLWPAVWLLPNRWPYGSWPASGEIDVIESRGNNVYGDNNVLTHNNSGSTLHWGPYPSLNSYYLTASEYQSQSGLSFSEEFNVWTVDWTDQNITAYLNGEVQLVVDPTTNFFDFGGFDPATTHNPWTTGGKMAPFDQKMYLILNLAVGGTGGFFPDGVPSTPPKPWINSSPNAMRDFWEARADWYPTWTQGESAISENAALQIDYIRVYKMTSVEM